MESAKLREKINWQKTIQVRLESKIQELELTIQNLQSDYEQELTSLRSDHRKELAQCKDEMLNQLAAVEAESMHIDENAIREKYMGEIDRIKVSFKILTLNGMGLSIGSVHFLDFSSPHYVP